MTDRSRFLPPLRAAAGPCALGGVILIALGLVKLTGLPLGPFEQNIAVGIALAVLALAAFLIVLGSSRDLPLSLVLLLPIGAAFFIRCLCMDHVTLDYVDFLSGWCAFFRDNGGWAAIALPKGNYNVPYLYFLAALSYLPIPDLYGIKLFSVLFDVLLAWGGLRLVRVLAGRKFLKPYAAFILLLFLPTVILNGSYWGQCDAVYGALCLHALAFGLERKGSRSVILLALAFSFKLQTIFLIPLWAGLWAAHRVKFRHLLLFPVTCVLTAVPALVLGKPWQDIAGVYLGQVGQYSRYLTLNAPSVYALIPYGAEVDVPAAALVGICTAGGLTVLLLLVLLLTRKRVNETVLLTAAVLLSVGVPLFLPHMHDRYFFLADVLTLCWACTAERHFPQALAVQLASLGGYHAYLVLRYAFPMSWGAAALVAVLVSVIVILWNQLEAADPPEEEEPEEEPEAGPDAEYAPWGP